MTDELPVLFYYIGRKIREERERRGISQTKLADVAQIGRTSIVNCENGKQRIQLETLYRIAQALDCEPGLLLPAVSKKIFQTTQEAFLAYLNQREEVQE